MADFIRFFGVSKQTQYVVNFTHQNLNNINNLQDGVKNSHTANPMQEMCLKIGT